MSWINEASKDSKPATNEPKEVAKKVSNPFISVENNKGKRGLKVAVFGKSGTGKTRLGYTFPEPVYFIDTEMGATPIANDFKDKQIFITEIWEKSDDEVMERDEVACFEKIKEAIEYLYKNPPQQGTIVIDSATDLWSMCQSYCKVKLFKLSPTDRLKYQFDWGKITNVYKQLITKLLTMPCNVLLCGRSKEIYDGPNPTGDYGAHLQKDTEYFVDVLIQMKKLFSKTNPKFLSQIEKCRMNGRIMGKEIENLTYEKLKELIEGGGK